MENKQTDRMEGVRSGCRKCGALEGCSYESGMWWVVESLCCLRGICVADVNFVRVVWNTEGGMCREEFCRSQKLTDEKGRGVLSKLAGPEYGVLKDVNGRWFVDMGHVKAEVAKIRGQLAEFEVEGLEAGLVCWGCGKGGAGEEDGTLSEILSGKCGDCGSDLETGERYCESTHQVHEELLVFLERVERLCGSGRGRMSRWGCAGAARRGCGGLGPGAFAEQ